MTDPAEAIAQRVEVFVRDVAVPYDGDPHYGLMLCLRQRHDLCQEE